MKIKTIKALESDGFKGTDVDLDTSLVEYGLAWLVTPEDNAIEFLYSVNGSETVFDRYHTFLDENVREEYNWVDWISFLEPYGMSECEFDELPVWEQYFMLFREYGKEDIFGSTYYEGETVRTSSYDSAIETQAHENDWNEAMIDALADSGVSLSKVKGKTFSEVFKVNPSLLED